MHENAIAKVDFISIFVEWIDSGGPVQGVLEELGRAGGGGLGEGDYIFHFIYHISYIIYIMYNV